VQGFAELECGMSWYLKAIDDSKLVVTFHYPFIQRAGSIK